MIHALAIQIMHWSIKELTILLVKTLLCTIIQAMHNIICDHFIRAVYLLDCSIDCSIEVDSLDVFNRMVQFTEELDAWFWKL